MSRAWQDSKASREGLDQVIRQWRELRKSSGFSRCHRYDKTVLSFKSFRNLAAARPWLKSFVNTS